jgi:hypothetical protein
MAPHAGVLTAVPKGSRDRPNDAAWSFRPCTYHLAWINWSDSKTTAKKSPAPEGVELSLREGAVVRAGIQREIWSLLSGIPCPRHGTCALDAPPAWQCARDVRRTSDAASVKGVLFDWAAGGWPLLSALAFPAAARSISHSRVLRRFVRAATAQCRRNRHWRS